jgi:hypothetical protein
MKENPDNNSKLTVFRGISEADTEQRVPPYGKEWLGICKTILVLRGALESAKSFSNKDSWEVADSVSNLLEAQAVDDRLSWCSRDLDIISDKARKEHWGDEKVNTELSVLQQSYLMKPEDLNYAVQRWKMSKSFGASIPDITLRQREHGDLDCRLYHLTHLSVVTITRTENGFNISLEPVRDGGIDSVAYPVQNVKIAIKQDEALDLNYNVIFWRRTELDSELDKHPEIVSFIKASIKERIDMYRLDNDNFIKQREWDGDRNDKTQILGSLYAFVDKYLSGKLDGNTHKKFIEMKKYIDSGNVIAALSIKALVEELLDKEAYVNQGYYAEKYPGELKRINEKAWGVVEEIGGKVENGEITNFYEIIQRAAKDKKFAAFVNRSYASVFSVKGEKFPLEMIKEEIDRWISLYHYDLENNLYTRALQKVRGGEDNSGQITL